MANHDFARYSRFLFSLVPAIILLLVTLSVAGLVNARLAGGVGLTIALVTAGCLAFGILLVYWNAVDWFNMRTIRAQLSIGSGTLKDGTVVAFSGVVRSDDAPMVAPLTGKACAAYVSVVAVSRSGSTHNTHRARSVIVQSFHMNHTRIEGDSTSLTLGSLPGFETDMRESDHSDKWAEQVHEQTKKLAHCVERTTDINRESLLQSLRNTTIDEYHYDFCRSIDIGDHKTFVVDEEVLPIDTEVTVIGTYDRQRGALIARNSRLGPNLIVYKGSKNEVLARISSEILWYAKFTKAMLGFAMFVVTIALMPDSWLSHAPLLRVMIVPWN